MPSSEKTSPAAILDDDSLPPLGIAAVIVLSVGLMLPAGEARDWNVYLAVGIVLPLLVLALNIGARGVARRTLWSGAAGIGLLAAFLVISTATSFVPVLLAAIAVVVRRRLIRERSRARGVLDWLVASAAWCAAATLLWWTDGVPRSLTAVLLVVATTALCTILLVRNEPESSPALHTFLRFFAPAVILLASMRADRIATDLAMHHWSYVIGPADLIRRGGWLMWDVPSQYGFLSMVTLAAVPGANRWQALYALNTLLFALTGTFTWYVLQALRRDVAWKAVALPIALSATFLLPGWAPELTGPMEYPSSSAFRFVWVYALLAVVFWYFATGARAVRTTAVVGAIAWAAGSLWSSESAAFSFASWIPAASIISIDVFLRARTSGASRARASSRALAFFAAGPAVLLSAIVAIEVWYRTQLGHAPEWRAFFEYSSSYATKYATIAAAGIGAWFVLLLVLCLGAGVVAALLRARALPALALATAAWGALWSASSYFVARSHPNNVTNLTPVVVTALALILLAGRAYVSDAAMRSLDSAAVALFSLVLAVPLLNPNASRQFAVQLLRGYDAEVAASLPQPLRALIDARVIGPSDPVLFLSRVAPPPVPMRLSDGRVEYLSPPPLIPALPSIFMDNLSRERREVYITRYIERTKQSGWLIQPRPRADDRIGLVGRTAEMVKAEDAWLIEVLLRNYRPVRTRANDYWAITRIEYHPARP